MSVASEAESAAEYGLPRRTFGPPTAVVVGTLVAGFVFAVALEFLVIISFIGQRLWRHPDMLHDPLFTLPLLLWVLVAVATGIGALRVLTSWLRLDDEGFELRGLARRTRQGRWDEVGGLIAVRDIDRGATPAEMLEDSETAYDGVYVTDRDGHRIVSVSSRFFGHRAQRAVLQHARAAGARIEHIDAISPAELRRLAPQAMTFTDRHPNLVMLLLVLFYVGHNLLTFIVWGL